MMKVNTIRRSRFFIFFSSVLEYGLHFATVTSRRDPQFIVGGALEGTTKNALSEGSLGKGVYIEQMRYPNLQPLGHIIIVPRRYRYRLLVRYTQLG
jgi:hypothetical protein